MKFSDILIIYLSCGAPFGVYFFLQNKSKLNSLALWVNSFLTMIVWFPYAFRFLHQFITNKLRNYKFAKNLLLDSNRKLNIDEIERQMSQILLRTNLNNALFEFRETFERYAGLTIAVQSLDDNPDHTEKEKEFFTFARGANEKNNKTDIKIGAKCLNRRNRNRLLTHQINARKDFLELFNNLNSQIDKTFNFKNLAIDFVRILNDSETETEIINIFEKPLQTVHKLTVNELESELWKPKQSKITQAQNQNIRMNF